MFAFVAVCNHRLEHLQHCKMLDTLIYKQLLHQLEGLGDICNEVCGMPHTLNVCKPLQMGRIYFRPKNGSCNVLVYVCACVS